MNKDSNFPDTALLVMDMQVAVIRTLADYGEITSKVARTIEKARSRNIPVLFIIIKFRAGMPEISMNNKLFSASKQRSLNVNMDELMKIDETVAPLAGEIIIEKRRVSAFTGSDLDIILRAKGIQHLVVTGVSTSGVVLSTLCDAADRDYQVTILEDCCTDSDRELHKVLNQKVFPRQAAVISSEEWDIL